MQNEKIDKFTGPVRQIDGYGVSMKHCVSVPSAVRLFNGTGCVKNGLQVERIPNGYMKNPKKNCVGESDAFDAQQTCSDFTFNT